MAFSWFEVAKEGSSHGSEFRGGRGPFLLEPPGRLPGGRSRFECMERKEGTVGKRTRVSKRKGGTQVWDKYSGLRAKAAYWCSGWMVTVLEC